MQIKPKAKAKPKSMLKLNQITLQTVSTKIITTKPKIMATAIAVMIPVEMIVQAIAAVTVVIVVILVAVVVTAAMIVAPVIVISTMRIQRQIDMQALK